jgi:hypothetical protein
MDKISASVLMLTAMVFMHIIADFNLQGILAEFKQKKWWEDNYPDSLYKHDWIISLITHSFQWSFMMMIPGIIYWIVFSEFNVAYYLFALALNVATHSYIDHMKANQKVINLVTDQICHLAQIVLTFIIIVH